MGTVRTEITLVNAADMTNARTGLIKEHQIRSLTVSAVVDTGADTLVINEEQCQKLGLLIHREDSASLADGRKVTCKITEGVRVCWKERDTLTEAWVLPNAETVLLGALPLEAMDLMIHPKKQELTGVHGSKVKRMIL